MVGGKVILRDGHFTCVDQPAALAELASQMQRPATAIEQRNRTVGLALMQFAQLIYADYLKANRGEPFYRSNARS
jgi:hypothetical protein